MKNIKTEIIFLIVAVFAGLVGIAAKTSSAKGISLYPTPYPVAHVLISPMDAGLFSVAGNSSDFVLTVINHGGLGSDTYDITAASPWSITLYAADGITLLTDTDSDGTMDTGPISQAGGSLTIVARVATPAGATLGNPNTATVTACSSLDISKCKTATLQSAIPAVSFAQTYINSTDGAMSFELIQPESQVVKKATEDRHGGEMAVMAAAPNGNFIYTWSLSRCLEISCNTIVNEIEYTLLDHSGNTIRAVSKLTDHNGATMETGDMSPSVAVAPNGTIGIVWVRHLNYYTPPYLENYNVYFAILDSAGNLISGPANITNNTIWGGVGGSSYPTYFYPAIAASDDNHFIIGWNNYETVSNASNIWYAAYDAAGTSIFSPTVLTSDNDSYWPVLNSLTGGKVILTWFSSIVPNYGGIPTYAVLDGNGAIFKAATTLGLSNIYDTPDAVQMPNGKVAVAWATNTGAQYDILNSSYMIESGPHSANNPSLFYSYGLSVTTDSSSHVIMTWQNSWLGAGGNQVLFANKLGYALGDSTGTFITSPMVYKNDPIGVNTSFKGQGNAPYTKFGDVPISYWSINSIERLYTAGITGGCTTVPLNYCPTLRLHAAQMAIFLLRGMHGSAYTPPAATGTKFTDVSLGTFGAAWIEQLATEGITSGCGGGNYCPTQTVSRAQMAIFLVRARHGSSLVPPTATGIFPDVPVGSFGANYIEQLAADGITSGCGGGLYCPNTMVKRDSMAVFLVKTFNLP